MDEEKNTDEKAQIVEDIYVLNGRKLTEAEFLEEKKTLESKPGVTLIEVSPTEYKTRIQG